MSETIQKFQCLEPDCPAYVEYVPSPILGLLGATRLAGDAYPVPSTVYLVCPNGHEHVYNVDPDAVSRS